MFGITSPLNRLLALTAAIETATGLVLMAIPAVVVRLLLGMEISGASNPLSRLAGLALLSLGVACWPQREPTGNTVPALRAMLIYNVLIALYLAYLGRVEHLGGVLLWSGVALHTLLALLLIWTWRGARRAGANDP